MLSHAIVAAAAQAWSPFVLVAGLLLIGGVAAADGLFEAIGGRFARSRLAPRGLLFALLALVAIVTAILNLDTSVVFLTPVLVHAARRRGLDELPFLYGSVFMSNAASLLLPGSNLTNLLVLGRRPVGAAAFGLSMLAPWLVACVVTAAFVAVAFRRDETAVAVRDAPPPLRLGTGAVAVLAAAALVVALPHPALPVLALGLAANALARRRPRVDVRSLALLFALAVALGTLARAWDAPARLAGASGRWTTAALAALAAVLVNNLPAAVLFSAQPPAHPRALLLGLDLGPNLAASGSLSAFLWLSAARAVGARASLRTYSRLGIVLVPLTLTAALVALRS